LGGYRAAKAPFSGAFAEAWVQPPFSSIFFHKKRILVLQKMGKGVKIIKTRFAPSGWQG
jgi:hypothetical protein